MGFKLTVGRKIGLGFGFLILLIVVVFGATFFAVNDGIKTFEKSNETSSTLIESITPSKEKIAEIRISISESKQLAIQWVNQQSRSDASNKIRLKTFINKKIPEISDEITRLSKGWEDYENVTLFDSINKLTDQLFVNYQEMMSYLPDLESYDDALNVFQANDKVMEANYIADGIDQRLELLQDNFELKEEDLLEKSGEASKKTTAQFEGLRVYWILGALLIILAIVIAVFTTRTIVRPVRYLRKVLIALGKGIMPKRQARVGNDEIGEMSHAMNQLVSALRKTTEFAREVGQSRFDSVYHPLSEDDELGHALLVMRDELQETEQNLERKVKERTEEVVKQRDEIEKQRGKLQELYKDVTDSIVYAKRLQNTILPSPEKVKKICPGSMVLYKPKDIVSGDFYWFEKINGKSLFAAVDCTGHGVPGAFMSLLGSNGLNSAISDAKIDKPAEILDFLNRSIHESFHKKDEENEVRDGMDVAICSIDYETLTLEYSGANNPLYIIRNGEFLITKPDKMAIGSFVPGEASFTNHTVQLEKGDMIYIFSDGYPDQFGGPRGRKLMYNNFRDYLQLAKNEPIEHQEEFLNEKLKAWQGKMDQVDDILLIGLKV